MYTELCLVWPNKTTDKLPREIHVKQLLVDSMLCFSFDRPVTDNCNILVLKKIVQDWKNITSGFELYPPDFNRDESDLQAYNFLMSNKKKTHLVSLNTHRVQSECLLPESTNHGF